MYARLKKLSNNVLSGRAFSVLGAKGYLRYLGQFVVSLPQIAKRGDLVPLDQAMSGKLTAFRYRGGLVRFDTGYCDREVADGTFAFGSVRELYIRDCYFCHLPRGTYENAKVFVDLGSNRGAFSSLVAPRADRLVAVEASGSFLPVIRHNLRLNGASEDAVEIGFIGDGGVLEPSSSERRVSMEELLSSHGITAVDVMKIDIEGSEYGLLTGTAGWLDRVRAITMEVHPSFGDTGDLVARLRQRGFTCLMANENLDLVSKHDEATFVYAWRAT